MFSSELVASFKCPSCGYWENRSCQMAIPASTDALFDRNFNCSISGYSSKKKHETLFLNEIDIFGKGLHSINYSSV